MQFDKSKIIIVLIGCFLGASVIAFLLKRDGNLLLKDKPTDEAEKSQLHESSTQQQPEERSTESLKTLETYPQTQSYNIEDLEALSGDLLEGDIGDVMDMEELMDMTPSDLLAMKWNSLEVACDFDDYEKVTEAVDAIPVSGEPNLSEEQEQNIKEFCSRMLFHNGRNEVDGFFSFLKESGETINEDMMQVARKYLVEAMRMTDEELPADPWKLVELYWRQSPTKRTAWSGFVQDGSEIRIQIAKDKHGVDEWPGRGVHIIRRAQSSWGHFGKPPISLEEMIELKREVLVADAILFIAHDESLSGDIFPYFIRYWFDPINNIWRPHLATCYPRRGSGYHHGLAY